MKKFLILIVTLIFCLTVFAQVGSANANSRQNGYNEKEILKKRADRYTSRRDYEKANTLYRELIEKYPDDWQIVEKLLSNLLRVSKFDETNELLEQKKNILPEYNYLRIKIPLLLSQGDTSEANDLADDYIKKNKTNIKAYQQLSNIFSGSRQYEKAADILDSARKIAKDQYLYTLEMARAYQSSEKNDLAVNEFLKHLEKNKHYLHYVMNNIKGILNRDEKIVSSIEKFADNSKSPEVKEVLALSFAYVNNYEKALLIYAELEPIKLFNFAEEQFKSKRYDIALNAYELYQTRESEVYLVAEAQLMKAKIYINTHNYDEAEIELQKIYNNKNLQKSKYRYKSKASQQSRILLAQLAVITDKPDDTVIKYYQEAQNFAYNEKDKKNIAFAIVDYKIKSGNLNDAAIQLENILQNENPETDIYKKSIFYKWQIALMNKEAEADSLLGELIISLPDNPLTTTALYLTQVTTSLPQEWHEKFYNAWRLNGLYKKQEAQEILIDIFENTGNDEIQLLLAEWEKDDDISAAVKFWEADYENDLLYEYSQLQLLENATADSTRIPLITSFLKENPNSIFAPVFRSYLEKAEGRLK